MQPHHGLRSAVMRDDHDAVVVGVNLAAVCEPKRALAELDPGLVKASDRAADRGDAAAAVRDDLPAARREHLRVVVNEAVEHALDLDPGIASDSDLIDDAGGALVPGRVDGIKDPCLSG
jgi:hypothetical protein